MADKHIMIDLETHGTSPDSVFISIGAVEFDPNTGKLGKEFYCNVSVEDSKSLGRKECPNTLAWWAKQSEESKKVLYKDEWKLKDALTAFRGFVKSLGGTKIVWAKSPSFDIVMLDHALKQVGSNAPWQFWNTRDCRTIKALGKDYVSSEVFKMPEDSVAHYALDDAKHQAKYVSALWQALRNRDK